MTSAGVILGTAAYMSPEQARGKPVDKRTDIWAFGCVLYEALTGRQEFGGETISDCIAKVLQKEPDWEALPEKTPWGIQRLLRRCLQKDSHERLQHIGDARIEVSEALSEPFAVTPPGVEAPPPRSSWRQTLPWALFGIMVIVATAVALVDSDEISERMGRVRFSIPPPQAMWLMHQPSISPDGKWIVFDGHSETGVSLWVRETGSEIVRRLEGTEGHQSHFWSPDSRFIAFFANGKLKKMDLLGGPAVSLADAPSGSGGTWNREGTMVIAPSATGPLYQLPAAGGEPMPLTKLDESRQQTSHQWPYFLPDGHHFLDLALSKLPEETAIYLGSLDSDKSKLLLRVSSPVVYAPPGYLLFVRERTLLAQPFDLVQLKVSGEPLPVAEDVAGRIQNFSVSENGTLVYATGFGAKPRRLVWRNRSGEPLTTVADPGAYIQLALSPDQQRVAVSRRGVDGKGLGIWLLEIESSIFSRFTFDHTRAYNPTWSPDGHHLAFASEQNGPARLARKPVDGGEVEILFESEAYNWPKAWSRDGDIVFISRETQGSVYALRVGKERKPEPRLLFQGPSRQAAFQLAPDEEWIAYHSNESGRLQVYIATFPNFSRKRQVSQNGGSQPQWRGDGKELFFLQLDGRLMSAPVATDALLRTGIPKVLFQTHARVAPANYQYFPTSDGQRFLFIEPEEGKVEPIRVVLNWHGMKNLSV